MFNLRKLRGLGKALFVACLTVLCNSFLLAQRRDSLNLSVGLGTVTSTNKDLLPLYLVSNQWGEVSEDQRLFLKGDVVYEVSLLGNMTLSTGFAFRNDVTSSHFLKLKFKEIEVRVGRERLYIGGLDSSLSSGSMGLSRNAQPIPMIFIGISEYVDVPFTNGYFKTKGHLSHGWFEEDRYISNALLHSKSFYLKLDLEEEIGWTAASGVVHFAQYGGISSQGDRQPSSFSDFLRVFTGSGIPNPDGTTEGESNGLGNHLGIIETTVTQRVGRHNFALNYQKPFEDFGSLQYISLTDYLLGLEWDLPETGSFIDKVYFEYIQTKWQGGPGLPDPTDIIENVEDNFGYQFGGRDDNYNNFLYRSGWTYQGQVIGNPLFLTYERTLNFMETYPDYGVAIASNRIRAVHMGVGGKLGEKVSFEGLLTYTQNFGTYAGLYEGRFAWNGVIDNQNFDYVFLPMQEEFYTHLKFRYNGLLKGLPVNFELRLSYDFGDLYRSFGSEISITHNLTKG